MKKKSVKQNYIYNTVYQVVALIFILVTTPYVARVLGAEKVGIYSYTYSIVTYFILIGSLGISLYGQREIAYCQDDKEKRTKTFLEIFLLRFILGIVSLIVYYFSFCTTGEYKIYYIILILELVASFLDIIWFFQGIEDFLKVVIRNVIIKIIAGISIIIFVKNPNDLWKYVIIFALSNFIGNISLWVEIPNYITKIKFKDLNIFKHLKPTFILFIPQIAIQIYTVLDKTMIGFLTDDMSAVGIYQKTQDITKLGLTVITAYGTVAFPRMANHFIKKENKKLNDCVKNSFSFLWLIALPITIGLMAISYNFVPWFLGKDFLVAKDLLVLFSLVVIVIALNNVVGMQYLIATKQQKFFSVVVAIGALINVVLNFFLIRKYSCFGAVIATLAAETAILIMEFIQMKDIVKNNFCLNTFFKCLFSSLIMGFITYYIGRNMEPVMLTTIIQSCVGIAIYFTILLLLKEGTVINNLYAILRKLRRK